MTLREMLRHEMEAETSAPPAPKRRTAREQLQGFVVTQEKVKHMAETRMIWRDLIASGHMAVWAAPGNGGKTTIAKLAAAELAAAGYEVMFFQEDAGAGDLPALFEHAQASGYMLLNSMLSGHSLEDQVDLLHGMVDEASDLAGTVMFFDTLKKFLDLMSKAGARAFFALMRGLTLRGATIVLLGHTNKNRGLDGKLVFEGVGDVRNDVDELLYIDSTGKDARGMVTMTIKPDKVRCVVREATFCLDTSTMMVSALPEVVDVEALNRRTAQMAEDAELIGAIRAALKHGGMPKTALVEQVAGTVGIGLKAVSAVVKRYSGASLDDDRALWFETYIRTNNVHYMSLKPEAKSAL